MVEEDTPDPDEPTLEQLQALERELMRVVGNRGVPFGPVLLPLVSHEEAIAWWSALPSDITDAQFRDAVTRLGEAKRAAHDSKAGLE